MKKSLISVLEVKKLRKEEQISKDEYHKQIVDIFTKSLDFKFSEVIGRGSFSTVLRVWNEEAENGFAMKIVLNEDIGPKETEWGQLHDENILPLIDTESFPVFDLTWYLSPVVELTLVDFFQRKTLHKDYMASKFAVSCMKQVASALNYMHKKELGFLNLKPSNVMISKDDKIKLFGFHRLSKIGEFTRGYDVPDVFKPPESYSADGRKLPVEGQTFDLWCLGVLSVEVFTGTYLTRNMPDEVCCWSDIIYPQMFKILKKNKFNKKFRFAFPNCNVGKNTLKLMRNFSRSCLRISPESRPSTEILLHHKLFEETGLLAQKDEIWKKKLKAEAMKQKIKNMNFLFECIEPVTRNANIQTDGQQTDSDYIEIEDQFDSDYIDNEDQSDNDYIDNEDQFDSYYIDNEDQSDSDDIDNEDQSDRDDIDNEDQSDRDYIDNEDFTDSKQENVILESGANKVLVEKILPNNGEHSEEDDEMLPYDISPPVTTESSDNLFLAQEMFGRIVVGHCQDNLTCRLLHREAVVKTMRNFEYKRKDKDDAYYSENEDNDKSMDSSSRTSGLGFKIASKMFRYFI